MNLIPHVDPLHQLNTTHKHVSLSVNSNKPINNEPLARIDSDNLGVKMSVKEQPAQNALSAQEGGGEGVSVVSPTEAEIIKAEQEMKRKHINRKQIAFLQSTIGRGGVKKVVKRTGKGGRKVSGKTKKGGKNTKPKPRSKNTKPKPRSKVKSKTSKVHKKKSNTKGRKSKKSKSRK
jgi:hypothetical protein